jgi:LysR family transcriptional regulator for bpeEF and oprC
VNKVQKSFKLVGMDKLNSLIIFVRAAQNRSFSEAARQMGMSPSSVSKAVQRLEEELGIRLLNRTTRSVTLTDDGAAFYVRCRQIIDELEEAEQELLRTRYQPSGTLRIDLTMALGRMHIVGALPLLTAKYPELKLDVSLNDRFVDLIEEGIDAVVRLGIGTDSRLIMHRVATVQFVVCASPDYFKRHGIPKTPQDLKQHNCINFVYPQTRRVFEWRFQHGSLHAPGNPPSGSQSPTAGNPLAGLSHRNALPHQGEQFEMPVEGSLRFDHAESLLEAAIAGAGIVQVLNYVAGRAIAGGELQPILEDYAAPGEPISVIYPQKRHLSAKVRAFIDFMVDLMGQLRLEKIVE